MSGVRRMYGAIRRTPLISSAWLSELARGVVSLKLESLQLSNSFKSRGAFNAVIARLERGSAAPARLVTASAGNHGRALAAAAEIFRLPLVESFPDPAELEQEIRITVLHELAHYFGLDEDRLDDLGFS